MAEQAADVSAETIRVLLVDDHPVVRDGLSAQLESTPDLTVTAQAGTAAEALAMLHRHPFDVAITDLRMPGTDGIDLISRTRSDYPQVEVMVLTTYDGRDDIDASLAAGARSYLLKETTRSRLFEAVRATARGRRVLSPSVRSRCDTPSPESSPLLSEREREVLELVAIGRTNAQVGAALFVGEATVKTHLQHVYDKLGVRDRAAAVARAHQRRLL